MLDQIVSQPTDVATVPPTLPALEADVVAYQRAIAWLQNCIGEAISRKMEWHEYPPYQWHASPTRPLRYWMLTAHTPQGMLAIDIGLNLDGTYSVIGAVAEARG